MPRGKAKRFNEFRGWGFITDSGGQDYFVHYSQIEGSGFRYLRVGEEVDFEIGKQSWGGHLPQALNVRRVVSPAAAEPPKKAPAAVLPAQGQAPISEGLTSPGVQRTIRLKDNPFNPQDPITDAVKFAGRREPLRNAVDALFNKNNIIITGDRGIGKSSLAIQLLYMTEGEKTLLDGVGVDTTGFDFNYIVGDHRCDPGQTLGDILEGLTDSLKDRLSGGLRVPRKRQLSNSTYRYSSSRKKQRRRNWKIPVLWLDLFVC